MIKDKFIINMLPLWIACARSTNGFSALAPPADYFPRPSAERPSVDFRRSNAEIPQTDLPRSNAQNTIVSI